MHAAVHALAKRASSDPHFAAHSLAAAGLPDAELCGLLRCDADTLAHVRLCRAPAGRADLERIAGKFGLDAPALARLCGVA